MNHLLKINITDFKRIQVIRKFTKLIVTFLVNVFNIFLKNRFLLINNSLAILYVSAVFATIYLVKILLNKGEMVMLQTVLRVFRDIFPESNEETKLFFSPGRVNLIGEHTDYNGGHVFPCALSIGTYAAARLRQDNQVNLYSTNFPDQPVSFLLDELFYKEKDGWGNYPKGVLAAFIDQGYKIGKGLDLLFYGNIPNGAGLSSSASLELAVSVVLNNFFSLSVEPVHMAKLSQKAENEFVGMNCGIMDQFAVAMGKKDHAVRLNCQTMEYQYSPLTLTNESIIIANTNKRRELSYSKYNERREECERALAALQTKLDIRSLGDVTIEQFEENQHLIVNPTDRKRAKHAVYENIRTIQAVDLLNKGDIQGFGQLMNQSHLSLRDDYEVSGRELDALAEAAWMQDGVIGSRMTGAGFGGCTVSIVKNEKIESFKENVGLLYKKETGLEADFYLVETGNGAGEIFNTENSVL